MPPPPDSTVALSRRSRERIGIIVQARMTSRRFPGKVLADLAGRPLLAYLLERMALCREADAIVVATSEEPSDNPIAAFCAIHATPVVRGSLDDVAGRMLQAAEAHGLDAFVRVCGDSPLLDPALVDMAVARFRSETCDVVTNVHPRSYPRGQSVEVVRTEALRHARAGMRTPEEREHVTGALYRRAQRYRIVNLPLLEDLSHLSFCVDTPADGATMAALIHGMTRPHGQYGVHDLVQLLHELRAKSRA